MRRSVSRLLQWRTSRDGVSFSVSSPNTTTSSSGSLSVFDHSFTSSLRTTLSSSSSYVSSSVTTTFPLSSSSRSCSSSSSSCSCSSLSKTFRRHLSTTGGSDRKRKPKVFEHEWQPMVPIEEEELRQYKIREKAAISFFNHDREFVISALEPHTLPPEKFPEVAFVGVSNVGKSSLLNAVLGKKGLAEVSKTPGRTKSINFYRVGDGIRHPTRQLYCVDLPGYGHAAVSFEALKLWTKSASYYIFNRGQTLCRVCVLIDPQVGFRETDLQAMSFMDQYGVSFQVVLTKMDRLNNEARKKAVTQTKETLARFHIVYPTIFETSARTGEGINELRVSLMEAAGLPFGDEAMRERQVQAAIERLQLRSTTTDAILQERAVDGMTTTKTTTH